ncbi:hypothetical protein [Aquamicrobium terrae]|uniref:Uncharacterized protein n=1 Tax=Aquamicrobium terrae TaxID=1324945 RepID=A0ABV2MW67_9HYPH
MAVDPVTTALQALPDGADHLTAAFAGAAAGARVLPVQRHGNTYAPIDVPMGPGRSPWTAATRDHGRLRRLFAEHPDAVPAFVDQTEAGPRARIWSGGRLATIPTSYVRA